MIYFLLVIYSSIFVSFIQVAGECFPIKKSFLFRFSKCNHCQTELSFSQIIPIYSFILLKGKSKCCKTSIPINYFLLELITPIYFVLLHYQFSFSYHFFIGSIMYYFLVFFFVTDILYMHVPNSVMIFFFSVLLVCYFFFQQSIISLVYSSVISSCFYLVFFILFRKGIGLGDIKILIILSSFLGFEIGYSIFFLSIILGATILLIALVLKKVEKNKQVPFVPYIFASYILVSILMK
ncbi:prepilin peptidase [Listeria sp. FSL L7-0091]|uniref:Prepilin peptidase n=1 Tax=Listeria farberi TaxID=2713500 RepID=A0A7X0ZGN2_9LIST|nr:A24 family peptidase [Listeria farberi]MBC1374053.1 prepilin peptidase [Listeria farberi]MBC1381295.1 prepilin peptidase [Listeria farberi]MBC2260696.1 prepilin peptidase [Listeria farberi]MBC2286965.1 prepilin peptidase [Listeria farberi]